MIRLKNVAVSFALGALVSIVLSASSYGAARKSEVNSDSTITGSQLVKLLSQKTGEKPLVIQVGFQFLYEGGHIDGARWAGPASTSKGLQRLKDAVRMVPKNKEIVIYCGCCPWSECPNIKPAYKTLTKLGFRHVKMLYIPVDFAHDWIDHGFPIVKGDEPTSARKDHDN